MTQCIGSEIDVYVFEFKKLHNHMMVFEKMSKRILCFSPTRVDIWLHMK